jgi:hypothetical protein
MSNLDLFPKRDHSLSTGRGSLTGSTLAPELFPIMSSFLPHADHIVSLRTSLVGIIIPHWHILVYRDVCIEGEIQLFINKEQPQLELEDGRL